MEEEGGDPFFLHDTTHPKAPAMREGGWGGLEKGKTLPRNELSNWLEFLYDLAQGREWEEG